VAGLTLVGAFKGFVLRPREEDVTGGDQEKLVDARDSEEEPSGPFGPGHVFGTYSDAEGGGEGLAQDRRGVDNVGGLKKQGVGNRPFG